MKTKLRKTGNPHGLLLSKEAVIMTVDLAAGKIQSDLYAGWLRRYSEG